MNLDGFIKRPVLSTVISVFIVILGILGLISLPISSYPDIAPPTVSVSTTYSGASAQTVLNSVIAPLEEQINGVENMDYMSSSATNTGSARIDITFKQGTDPNMAAVNVQNRVSMAQGLMPAEVTRVGVITQKRQTGFLMALSLYDESDSYESVFIENYAKINIVPQLQRVNGVGDVMVMGGDYSIRIWMDPERMAEYHLMPADISAALATQNIEAAPGSIGERENNTFEYVLRYRGRLTEVSEFENIVLRATPDGEVLHLRDVARVELGRISYAWSSLANGHTGVSCMIMQLAGSNATQVIQDAEKVIAEAETSLPEGLKITTLMNANEFLFASIEEVVKTLIEAFVLVFLVVFLFLQDFRSTLIPAIAIPVALIGTFFVLYAIGFSINLLTLNALVLAIAIVVDDAIVVVEGVHAKLDQGYKSARLASIDAMRELGGAIVSITLVMMAVFIPVSFMSGTSGTFYRQFGLTMAIAIFFSAVNALTLSPALCAVFLKAHDDERPLGERVKEATAEAAEQMKKKYKPKKFSIGWPPFITVILLLATICLMVYGAFTFENVTLSIIAYAIAIVAFVGLFSKRFADAFNRFYDKLQARYKKNVERLTKVPALSIVLVAGSIGLLVWLMAITPSSLVPTEDQGVVMGAVSLSPGTSQDRTEEVLKQVDSLVAANPAVKVHNVISGYSMMGGQGSSYGSFIVKLKDFNERGLIGRADLVAGMLYLKCRDVIKDAQVLFFTPPMIPGYGAMSGFSLNLQDRTGGDLNKFFDVAQSFIAELSKRPEIQSAQTTFNPNFPQYMIDIDAAACMKAGLSPSDILTTLQGYIGSMYVSNFNRFGKMYRVMIQAERSERTNLESLKKIKVRNGSEMAPITQFLTISRVYGPDNINRFNMYTAIAINGTPADGYTTGEAIQAVKETAANLPQGYSYEFSSMSREEANSTNTTAIVFLLSFVFIYLLLSAQYESYVLPWAVLLSVPFGLMGSFLFIQGMGGIDSLIQSVIHVSLLGSASNNIYVQIALIMLIGLLAKNAILIIEFALERRKMGMSIKWAAILGSAARLRPILMTSFAMIIGLLPMMFAFGVGANGNRALGTTAIGGMLIGMLFQIFIVPVLFIIFQTIQEKFSPMRWEDAESEDTKADLLQYAE